MELVSIHFPKAAGTSFATSLKAHFGDALALDYNHDPVNPDHLLSEQPLLSTGVRAVHGHFRGDRYNDHRDAFRLTFLREPIDNLISIYYFWRTQAPHGNATHSRFLLEQPSVTDFARYYWPIRRLMSMSYFGGLDLRLFDFVGFHDSRALDLARLSKRLGIPLSPDVYDNQTGHTEERQMLLEDRATLDVLRSVLADDVAFYARARDHWGMS
jgi:hypothetical protein